MTNTLYVFIDESGNPTDGDYYVVSGTWCVSDRNRINEILLPTVENLASLAESQLHTLELDGELKGASLPTEVVEKLVCCLDDYPYDDRTITGYNLPWQVSHPLRFSVHDVNPDLGLEALDNIFSTPLSSPKALKTLSLASALNPVFSANRLDSRWFDDVQVVLDADVWTNPAKEIERGLGLVEEELPEMSFNTRDSEAVPGLQIADLAAFSWARDFRSGDCSAAVKQIHDYRFAQR